MLIDYKIVEERDENGIVYQKVRFYEGDIVNVDEIDTETMTVISIPRYQRTVLIEEVEYTYE